MSFKKADISLLIVDDDEVSRTLLGRRLESEEYQVDTAKSGPEALEKMTVERFDLVLLDLMMPGMNGDEVLYQMRCDPLLNDTIVMMLTADSDKQNVVTCL